MLRIFLAGVFWLFLTGCSVPSISDISSQALGDHLREKEIIVFSSTGKPSLWESVDQTKFKLLQQYWEPQKPNYCGVCSAVIVSNTLRDSRELNQDNFFTPPVKAIIKPATVRKMGLTLRELHGTLASLEPSLTVEKFYSHTAGLDLFIQQLKNYDSHTDNFMIVNFSRQSIAGTGMASGHFSIVAAYDAKSRMVLILEVNGDKESFWIKDRDLFTAMLAIDPVSRIPRGWLRVKK